MRMGTDGHARRRGRPPLLLVARPSLLRLANDREGFTKVVARAVLHSTSAAQYATCSLYLYAQNAVHTVQGPHLLDTTVAAHQRPAPGFRAGAIAVNKQNGRKCAYPSWGNWTSGFHPTVSGGEDGLSQSRPFWAPGFVLVSPTQTQGETATPASGPRPVRVRFLKLYRAPRVRSASGPRPLPFFPDPFPRLLLSVRLRPGLNSDRG
eukprot:gene13558-biopygen12560